jgi:hypothetical protein
MRALISGKITVTVNAMQEVWLHSFLISALDMSGQFNAFAVLLTRKAPLATIA